VIEINGMDNLVHNLSKYSDEMVKGVVVAAQLSQALIVNDAKTDHPYVDRSGNLTDSIQPGDVVIEDDEISAFVEARMQYASYVEFGTSRAKPYPFLVPAMLRQQSNFKRNVAVQIKKIQL
jgi:HK97 gp10 family phage protein